MIESINLEDKLSQFSEHWSPKIVAAFNGHDVMVVKLKGEFVWHSHADTDDFFFVMKGKLTIKLPDGDVRLGPGDLYVVPKGVEHCPLADEYLTARVVALGRLSGKPHEAELQSQTIQRCWGV